MLKFWTSKEFQKLNEEWEQKLAESGFKDIEEQVGKDRLLIRNSGLPHRDEEEPGLCMMARQEYFLLLAELFQAEKEFKDESDRLIMERAAEGKTIADTSKELKQLGLPKHNRDTIRYVRRRYEHKWEIKAWKPKDMVSRRKLIRS